MGENDIWHPWTMASAKGAFLKVESEFCKRKMNSYPPHIAKKAAYLGVIFWGVLGLILGGGVVEKTRFDVHMSSHDEHGGPIASFVPN